MSGKMSIQLKLIMANSLAIFLFILALWSALDGMFSASNESDQFFNENLVRQTAYQTMFTDGLLSGVALRNLVLKPKAKKPHKVVPAAIKRFDDAFKLVQSMSKGDESLPSGYASIQKHWTTSRAAKFRVLELVKSGEVDQAIELLKTVEHPNWRKVRIDVQKLVNKELAENNQSQKHMLENTNSSLSRTLIIAVIAIFASIIISFFVIKSIKNAFSTVTDSLNDIASGGGDLTQRLNEHGEKEVQNLSIAFNSFIEKIQNLVSQVSTSSGQLISEMNQLTELSVDTKLNVNQQEGKIEQVATAMNEMAATVQEVARNASQASDSAHAADIESSKGQQVVSEVTRAINDLAKDVANTSITLDTLKEDTQQIGSVLDVIKGIAEQTNLLALNAAIEAARAGEQGRGFAVVADEVRTLASRTQESTQEIQDMIERLQTGAISAVEAMSKGQKNTQTTVEKAELASQALSAITQAVSHIAEQNTQIATAAEEQSSVAEEINQNIVSINTLSVQAAKGAEHTAASSQELEGTAQELQQMISMFKV